MASTAFARVSTQEQSLGLQTDALTSAGAIRTFTDLGVSGSKASRAGLDAAGCVPLSGVVSPVSSVGSST